MTTKSVCIGKMWRYILFIFVMACSSYGYSQQTSASDGTGIYDNSGDKKIFGLSIDGYDSMRYLFRSASGYTDSELYELLSFNLGDLERDKVSFHFLGELLGDIGGNANERNEIFNPFTSAVNAFHHTMDERLYLSFLNIRDMGPLEYFRIGRQDSPEMPVNTYFDGGRLATKRLKDLFNLRLTIYGGVPVYYFAPMYAGNRLSGLALEGNPFEGNDSRLDMMHIRDNLITGYNTDTLWSFSSRQSFQKLLSMPLSLQGRATVLGNQWLNFFGNASYNDVDHDLLVQISYFNLWQTQNQLVTEFDPYFSELQTYFPYEQWQGSIYKGLGEHFAIEMGAEERSLKSSANISQFNREFTRYYITPTLLKFPTDKTTVSLTGEIWDSSENKVQTFGADITHKFNNDLKAVLGTSYDLYKFDYYSLAEDDNVRSYYLKVDYKIFKDTNLNFKCAFENDSFLNYRTFELGVTVKF